MNDASSTDESKSDDGSTTPAGEQLNEYKSHEMTADDMKIAKNRSKKRHVPIELSLDARRIEMNLHKAELLTKEFNDKLQDLGYILEPLLKFTDKYIKAIGNLRPMTPGELQVHKNFKREMARKEQAESGEKEQEAKAGESGPADAENLDRTGNEDGSVAEKESGPSQEEKPAV